MITMSTFQRGLLTLVCLTMAFCKPAADTAAKSKAFDDNPEASNWLRNRFHNSIEVYNQIKNAPAGTKFMLAKSTRGSGWRSSLRLSGFTEECTVPEGSVFRIAGKIGYEIGRFVWESSRTIIIDHPIPRGTSIASPERQEVKRIPLVSGMTYECPLDPKISWTYHGQIENQMLKFVSSEGRGFIQIELLSIGPDIESSKENCKVGRMGVVSLPVSCLAPELERSMLQWKVVK